MLYCVNAIIYGFQNGMNMFLVISNIYSSFNQQNWISLTSLLFKMVDV